MAIGLPDSKWLIYRERESTDNGVKQLIRMAETYTKNIATINSTVKKFENVFWVGEDKLYINSEEGSSYIRSGVYVENNQKNSNKGVHTDSRKLYIEEFDKQSTRAMDPILGAGYLDPVISPDGKKVAFEIIGGNMQVYDLTTFQLSDLGQGNRPKWSPNGKWLVYEITKDDGHTVTSSDLFMIRPQGTDKRRLTNTPNVHEMRASFFKNGSSIIYDTDLLGEIRTLRVSQR